MSPTTFTDDPSIPDDAELWRRVRPDFQKMDAAGRPRATSQAFQEPSNGTPMSVLLADQVKAGGRDLKDVLADYPGHKMASFRAGFARTLGLGIARDPTPQEPAHAVVVGNKTGSVRKGLSLTADLIAP
ncbi:MAG: hypothetical protein KGM47_14255 [Acidobacteriota bacterium]|nr:hypothetical protein [Acidobacteriota bacterium]